MNEKEEYPIEYRRYAAQAGFVIPPQNPPEERDQESDESGDSIDEALQKMSPHQKLKMLQNKVDSTLISKETLQEFMKALNAFIKLGYELEEYDLIIEYMKSYLEKRPRDNGIRMSMARVHLKQGKVKRAKIELRKILEHNPQFQQARDLLDYMRINNIK